MPRPEAAFPSPVLFVITSSDVGGSEIMLRELVLRLDPAAFAPTLLSLRPLGAVGREIAARGIPVRSLEMADSPRPHEMLLAIHRIACLVDELACDLVQSLLYRANVLVRLAAPVTRRRPLVVSGHHSLVPLGSPRATLAARWTSRLSDRIVVVSDAVRERLLATERLPPERVVVIQNGVDTARFAPGAFSRNGDLRARLGVPADALVIGAVGRLSPEKGVDHLLAAAALLGDRGYPVHVLLAGEGPDRARLEGLARSSSLDGRVHFLGLQRDLGPVLGAMDVYALPSLQEGMPMALLEAMAAARPIVATDVGGVREIVDDGRSALVVPAAAPTELADAFERLAGDRDLRERLASEARRHVVERFDVAVMVERYAGLYRSLLEARA